MAGKLSDSRGDSGGMGLSFGSPASGSTVGGDVSRAASPTSAPTSNYRSPAAGLGLANLQLPQQSNAPIPISPRANVTPDMLAPRVAARTEPDPKMDPAWYASVHGNDQPDWSQFTYKKGGAVKQPPSEAQKKAGNYAKGHIKFHGIDISIETPKGALRTGKDRHGKPWKVTMPADYGYVKGTEGADGDHVDVYVGPNKESQLVFIINQRDPETGDFDEHKAMLGYKSERDACADYCKAFSDGRGRHRLKSIEVVSIDAFKKWLQSGKTKKPAKSSAIVDHALKAVGRK